MSDELLARLATVRDTLADDRSIEDLGNDEETLEAAINRIRELEAVTKTYEKIHRKVDAFAIEVGKAAEAVKGGK